MLSPNTDTICAVATPAGKGGISVIRISGPDTIPLCQKVAGPLPAPGNFKLSSFRDQDQTLIDQGLVLLFKRPESFTGEDVCEFHIHGSPVVADRILEQLTRLGTRLARPGEFSERAFRNGKMDLVQAEAVADLINSSSRRAAQMAVRSLQGEFSARIQNLVDELTNIRVYLEASLDFPDEEVELLDKSRVTENIQQLYADMKELRTQAQQGQIIQEGLKVVIAGEPNAGKSTLLNRLSGSPRAIVTDIPGTTRDILEVSILVDGIQILLLDTAGLRISDDPVESEGIRRAWQVIRDADQILYLVDISRADDLKENISWQRLLQDEQLLAKLSLVYSKIDLYGQPDKLTPGYGVPMLGISALTGEGIDALQQHLLSKAGLLETEGNFLARRRHLDALDKGLAAIEEASDVLSSDAGELIAEHLRLAQEALGEITGKISQDDLLGLIFSSFCIGK